MLDFTIGYQPKDCKNGTDFENWVQGLLTAIGFEARRTGGNDNGVDIIATCNVEGKEYKYYIQCKLHNRVLGKAPVQEVYTGCQYFGGDGYPVVITNNRMTAETKVFAKKMGVELITELEFNELELTVKRKKFVNECHTGLFGIILAKISKDNLYSKRAVAVYNTKTPMITEPTDRERLKQEVIDNFEQAQLLIQECTELQLRANACQQQALALQKAAMIKNLDCP